MILEENYFRTIFPTQQQGSLKSVTRCASRYGE